MNPQAPELSRRRWLQGSLGGAVAAASSLSGSLAQAQTPTQPPVDAPSALPERPRGAPTEVAGDEAYWSRIAALYRVNERLVNLDNGFYGVMSRPVLSAYQRQIEQLNEFNSIYLRQDYGRDVEAVRTRIAAVAGVSPKEIALTRGATEAFQNLIVNYRGLKAGDTVLYADLDYDSAQATFDHLRERRGVNVAKLVIPEPATHQGILDAYAQAFERHPRTRLLLLTHISHKTGLIMPVAEVIQLAKARGIDAIVDAAHSWGQLDFQVGDLGADFVAFNLHKWMGAPLGVGFLYIRQNRLADVSPHLASDPGLDASDIRNRVHTGTTNTANVLTVPVALEIHERIGAAAKQARLRYLRDRWVRPARQLKGVDILAPDDPRLYAAITSFRLSGKASKADNQALVARLREKYGIFTVQRGGLNSGDCIRVTPAIYTRPAEVDRLLAALTEIVKA